MKLLSLSLTLALACAAAPVAHAASQPESCPAVVVVAARGSDQNEEEGEYFGPQRYSERSKESNGWEGPNWTAFFHFAERQYQAEHGRSLMDDVYVLGLDDKAYPAVMKLPPLAEEGETLTSSQIAQRLWYILTTVNIPVLARGVTLGALDSMRDGMRNAPGYVDAWEKRTGCTPQYIVAGYSQGAIVGTSLERHLAAKGQLAGALYLGNPLAHAASTATLGARGNGLASSAPAHLRPRPAQLPAGRRLNYCLNGDFSCDLTVQSALAALSTKAERHASYFLAAADGTPSAQDVRVARTFAGWVDAEREQKAE